MLTRELRASETWRNVPIRQRVSIVLGEGVGGDAIAIWRAGDLARRARRFSTPSFGSSACSKRRGSGAGERSSSRCTSASRCSRPGRVPSASMSPWIRRLRRGGFQRPSTGTSLPTWRSRSTPTDRGGPCRERTSAPRRSASASTVAPTRTSPLSYVEHSEHPRASSTSALARARTVCMVS